MKNLPQTTKFGICAIFLIVIIICLYDTKSYQSKVKPTTTTTMINKSVRNDNDKIELIEMSRILADAMKRIGQMSCKLSKNHVSQNGGWCSKIADAKSSFHHFDATFADNLGRLLAGKRVASFGDGPGSYKEYIDKQGLVDVYDAYDGAPFSEDVSKNLVSFLDLSVPVHHLAVYDWVVSVEVAEHIPREFETIYIENLVRHAKEGIVLSWSRPGQIGHSHVNNRDPEYVRLRLKSYGFSINSALTKQLRSNISAYWIKSNINVYVRNLRKIKL